MWGHLLAFKLTDKHVPTRYTHQRLIRRGEGVKMSALENRVLGTQVPLILIPGHVITLT